MEGEAVPSRSFLGRPVPSRMNSKLPQRKRPIHPPPVERPNEPIILLVTLTIIPRIPILNNAVLHDAFLHGCNAADTWSVGYYMIMPDHIHLFASPAKLPRISIKRWTGYLKECITKQLHRTGSQLEGEAAPSRASPSRPAPNHHSTWRWQPDCWDTQMCSQTHYHDKWEYVRQNPVRQNLVTQPEAWPWQGSLNVLRW